MNAGGIRTGHPSRTVVTGPLASYADGFRDDLGGRGYAARSIPHQKRITAQLRDAVHVTAAVIGQGELFAM